MIKNKTSNVYLNLIRIAVLCGIYLHPHQSAFAKWNQEIFDGAHLDQSDLKILKQRCVLEFQSTNNADQQQKWREKGKEVNEKFISSRKAKWHQRAQNVIELLRRSHSNSLSLVEKKGFLLDNNEYIAMLYSIDNTVSQVVASTKAASVQGKGLSLGNTIVIPEEEKIQVTSVIQEELTEGDIQSFRENMQAAGMTEQEINRQINMMTAQMQKICIDDTSSSEKDQVDIVFPRLSPVAQEISDLNFSVTLFGNSLEENRSKGMILAKLAKLERAHEAGVESYADEHELDYYMLPPSTFTGHLVEPVVQHTFTVEKEIYELENDVLPYVNAYGSSQDQEAAQTRLRKLKNAKSRGITTFTTEEELN